MDARLEPAVNVIRINELLKRTELPVYKVLVLSAVSALCALLLRERRNPLLLQANFPLKPVVNRSQK